MPARGERRLQQAGREVLADQIRDRHRHPAQQAVPVGAAERRGTGGPDLSICHRSPAAGPSSGGGV
jgi:hypothetical protein